ncbi:hypothetical protein GBF35_16285 [Nonomuraea phyllanthi]|uniref:hypothetical protein n=1 Tax=Nonomuraea phyllanthi TaxID=2219224 RepID=UPI0012939868|nr:hypothetical protein [Nonomuraea phyllanthi]QFY08029.1 hypothetical protein GBF35_16285 [Nonomuraea phyllanthi]
MMRHTITADDEVIVNASHVRGLSAYGPGWGLMWNGREVFIARAETADDGSIFEIVDFEAIAASHALRTEYGEPSNDDTVAADFTDIAHDYLDEWLRVHPMMFMTAPYTTALRPYGIHRTRQGKATANGYQIATEYRIGAIGATARIVMDIMAQTHRSATPIMITITGPCEPGTPPATTYTATVPHHTPPAAIAALIATAAGLPPHIAHAYPRRDNTGFPQEPAYIEVDVAHVRGLSAYGPGWTLMWDGTGAVITRAGNGDEGALLEIISYEDMCQLRDNRAEQGDPHDDRTIAADLTDILCDHHHTWADALAYTDTSPAGTVAIS